MSKPVTVTPLRDKTEGQRTVWIVLAHDWESTDIQSIHLSEETAIEMSKKMGHLFEVEEFELLD